MKVSPASNAIIALCTRLVTWYQYFFTLIKYLPQEKKAQIKYQKCIIRIISFSWQCENITLKLFQFNGKFSPFIRKNFLQLSELGNMHNFEKHSAPFALCEQCCLTFD